jgi:hypothetical protein
MLAERVFLPIRISGDDDVERQSRRRRDERRVKTRSGEAVADEADAKRTIAMHGSGAPVWIDARHGATAPVWAVARLLQEFVTRERKRAFMAHSTGISNRETPEEEARERREHPPVDTGSPEPEDAAGRVGEEPLTDLRDRHTSHKAGSRSIAQKEDGARYPDRSAPASHEVAGAFGKEPRRG